MELLEREAHLRTLANALEDATNGRGRIALVSGEAGIGKTTFVERFCAGHGGAMQLLKGQCDPLSTPSPLGPLYDIARQAGGRLLEQLESEAPRAALFSTVLDRLRGEAKPTLLLIEDIHWADEATLDLVRFLSRRIGDARALILLTCRGHELGSRHALRLLLGDLATLRPTIRIELPGLTLEAVKTLVGSRPIDPQALYARTCGNPFFITEVLAHEGEGLPRTVRDAVLARAAKLGPAGRNALQAAAVIGSRFAYAQLERILGGRADGLAECVAVGMLEVAGEAIAFRHELVREAVLVDLDPACHRELNRAVLASLRAAGVGRGELAQLAQLAEGAGDAEAVLEFGPAAARAAAAAGAHRAAAAQYRRVLAFAGDRPPAERARLVEAYAEECAIVDELCEASRARREAAALWRAAGDPAGEGANLAELAWPLVRSGQNAAAEDASRQAIAVLEAGPPTPQLAAAYRIQAHLRMLDRDRGPAVAWGRKAIELATRLGDDADVAAAEMIVGSAMLVDGDEGGRPHLDRSLGLARQAGLDSLVGLVYVNIGSSYGEQYQLAEAERQLAEGIAYTCERDLDHANHYMRSWLALTRLYQGRWTEAAEMATALLNLSSLATISRIMALIALGRVRARRGEAGAAAALGEALELALQTDTLQRVAPARAARAEAAWLAGDPMGTLAEARVAWEMAARRRHRWHTGELTFWLWRAGERVAVPTWSATPFRLQLTGAWRRAAAAWEQLGCPYEQARALADGDLPAQLGALDILDRLGAAPAAAALRQRMRTEGTRGIPRGPRAATRRNPFGLTVREMEILGCLADGLSNRGIGVRLHVSPKTVDHHVSSVLAKLGAGNRGEAARIARERALLPEASMAK
jgi:DNA-binding CsgD family transcriptional regulator